jgi:hypothetical protein
MKRLVVVALCAVLAACGSDPPDERATRGPVPAPRVELSGADRAAWAPNPPDRAAIPVLLFSGVSPDRLARDLTLLDHAGYETITLEALAGFVAREPVDLPARPLLVTLDGGRLADWAGADATLERLGFQAVLFVNVGEVEQDNPAYLTWDELTALEGGGRWDVQLQSGTGHRRIQYGPAKRDVGAFYAYRGSEEVLGGWRERVFSDINDAEKQLANQVRGYEPLAFAPPYGNYGQAGTNDPAIPRELLDRLELSFQLVFTQDRPGFATPGARNPIGRIEITPAVSERQLRAQLASGTSR